MKTFTMYLSIAIVLSSFQLFAQTSDTIGIESHNTANTLLDLKKGIQLGGYGEVHYNQGLDGDFRNNADLDVHRLVMFLGYNFNSKLQFVSEIEFEHVKELWVEQAFLQYKLHKFVNVRAGLMLIPMGMVNENHEPANFFTVERPDIDNKIAPSTWREIGAGFSGNIQPLYLKYQLYVTTGLVSYNDGATMSGAKPIRDGRQKGAEAFASSPAFVGKLDFYRIKGLNLGISGYYGKSQSSLYDGIAKDDEAAIQRADSSVVGILMLGADGRYSNKGLKVAGQFYYTSISNTEQYNTFTAKDSVKNNLGKGLLGYYGEIGYNVLQFSKKTKTELVPFVRLEQYNLHQQVEEDIVSNDKYRVTNWSFGFNVKLEKAVVLKTDLLLSKAASADEFSKTLNIGIGLHF